MDGCLVCVCVCRGGGLLRPTPDELKVNSRSRSALLHVLQKKKGVLACDLEQAVRHGRHYFWDRFSRVSQLHTTSHAPVICPTSCPRVLDAYWMLISACNMMVCPIHVFRHIHCSAGPPRPTPSSPPPLRSHCRMASRSPRLVASPRLLLSCHVHKCPSLMTLMTFLPVATTTTSKTNTTAPRFLDMCALLNKADI